MSEENPVTDRKLAEKLETLRAIPPRDVLEVQRRRTVFLSEVQIAAQAVSPAPKRRLVGWINPFNKKEIKPMFSSIVAILVALALALGGAGATVVTAQTALPGEALYGLKTASEDVRLALGGEENRLELSFEFTQRRMEEISALVQAGLEVPEGLKTRLQIQLQSTLQIAAAQQDQDMLKTLERLRTRLQEQDQLYTKLEEQTQTRDLLQTREMIQDRLRLVEDGLQDPDAFRKQVGDGMNRPTDQPEPGDGSPQATPGAGTGEPQYGTGEPQYGTAEPGYGTGEPQYGTGEPQYGTGEPQYGTGEPQKTPQSSDATPGSGTGEPGKGPGEPQPTSGPGGKP